MAEIKKLTKSDLKVVKKLKIDGHKTAPLSINLRDSRFSASSYSLHLLQYARDCYAAFNDIRNRARRSTKYYKGDQWGDPVIVNGKRMTEGEYISMQGKAPLKQNLIRPLIKNVLGQYRSNPFKSTVFALNREDQTASEMMTVALESAFQMNDGKERDARMLEMFLISSACIYDTSYTYVHDRQRSIPMFRSVNLNRFFCDTNIEDVMGEDIKVIGEIMDMSLLDLVSIYAKNEQEESDLRAMYASIRDTYTNKGMAFDEDYLSTIDFSIPHSLNLCRVIKVCVKYGEWALRVHDYADASYSIMPLSAQESIEQENADRIQMVRDNDMDIDSMPLIKYERVFQQTWRYYHLSPLGHILYEADCPYTHNSHPYVFRFYPMINGAVWSMVEDLMDQQKMVNRQIILYDFIVSASAKGVLLVPEEALEGTDTKIEDIAEEWTKYNGVIKIKTKTKKGMPIDLPRQIVANSVSNVGLGDMINLQMRLMQDIGGVHEAMQGKSAGPGTPATLYAQEAANSSLNILDYMESFASFCQKRDWKLLQIIKQFYQEKHYQALGSRSITSDAQWYDPDLIRNMDFDNVIAKGNSTPAFRMMIDDMLWRMLEGQFISIESFLEHSSFPFADKLLSTLRSQREQAEEAQLAGGNVGDVIPGATEQLQQLQQEQGGLSQSPEAMQLLQRILGRNNQVNQ